MEGRTVSHAPVSFPLVIVRFNPSGSLRKVVASFAENDRIRFLVDGRARATNHKNQFENDDRLSGEWN
jgi:hypothetical protein